MKITLRYIIVISLSLLLSKPLIAGEFTIAVRAHHGIDDAFRQWQATVEALNNNLTEHHFTLLPIVSLNKITERGGQDEFDFVLTNPSSFIELEKLYGAKVLVTLNNKRANTAQDRFGSVIFTHVENEDILTLHDLKNKTLMAVSEPAFGGWRVAWLEMLNHGFDPHDELKSLVYTKSGIQPDVVFAVLNREVDAGVVRTDRLERMEAEGVIDLRYLRILNNKEISNFPFFLSTQLYPEWAFVAMKSAPVELSLKIKKILLSLHPDNAASKAGKYMGWVEPRDYGPVRELMIRLKVGPYAKE